MNVLNFSAGNGAMFIWPITDLLNAPMPSALFFLVLLLRTTASCHHNSYKLVPKLMQAATPEQGSWCPSFESQMKVVTNTPLVARFIVNLSELVPQLHQATPACASCYPSCCKLVPQLHRAATRVRASWDHCCCRLLHQPR